MSCDHDDGPCVLCTDDAMAALHVEGHPPIRFCYDHDRRFVKSNAVQRGRILNAALDQIYGPGWRGAP